MSQVSREINNLQAQISDLTKGSVVAVLGGTNVSITGSSQYPVVNVSGVASGVSSLTVGGSGLLVNPTTGNVVIKNTGVTSLTAGTGISVSNTSGDIVVNNTGITSLTAGSGIAVSGSTITNSGVVSLTAGTNTTITGTSTNPIINLSPSQLPAGVSIDIANANLNVNVATLANAYFYSSIVLTAPRTIFFPNYASLVAQYGNNAVIPFTFGSFKQFAPGNFINIEVLNDTTPNKCFTHSNINPDGSWNGSTGALPSVDGYILPPCIFDGKVILDSDLGGSSPTTDQKAYITFNFRSQYIPST
jgi:hypothetical protein